jgi:hypothetical protein
MIDRDTMKSLIDFIQQRKERLHKLTKIDQVFYNKMKQDIQHYGYSFTEEQLKQLESIYRQVYNNI